jgi:hypothetical protein
LSASECFIGKWFEFRCGDHLHVAAAENVVDAWQSWVKRCAYGELVFFVVRCSSENLC